MDNTIKTGEGQESTDNCQLSIASCPLKRIALFPGTFDPFTIGHESLVSRGLELVDEIIISIGINDTKRTYFSLEKRLEAIQELYKDEPRVRVMSYDSLTVDFAQQMNAGFILRGIRTVNDFEYEKSIADVNRKLSRIRHLFFLRNRNIRISAPASCGSCCVTAKIFPSLCRKDKPLLKIKTMKRILLPLLILSVFAASMSAQRGNNIDARKLQLALYAISNLYVDSTSETKLVEDAIVGMLEKLDPHSTYTDPEETKEMTEPLQGNFDGIGIQFNMLTDTLYVIQVIPGGPSEKVGLMAGDRIIMVDDTLIAGVKMKNTDVMKRLRGPKNTEVRVKVLRGGVPDLIEFKITRGKIPVYSLDAAYMADKATGYIKLNRFAASSADEFREALEKLKKQGMKNLILDLQGNGGGYLNIAIDLADEFLGKDKLIVYTEGNKQPREEAKSSARGGFEEGRLVVLVDETSASASEILSGAVQDWDRGVVVGRRTFGKGLVQKPIPMPDGSMIRLTVARYYTPTGRSIQKPYVNGNQEQYNHDLIDRYNRGELMSADSIHFPDSMKYNTLETKRIVYGGGGIMPDVFIPVDTSRYTDYHRNVVAAGLVNRIAMNYLDRHRAELNKKYPKFAQYKQNFNVTDDIMQELVTLAKDDKIEFNEEQYNRSKPLIMLQIKALIARDLYDMAEYFQVINDDNESFQEALRLINDEQRYKKELGR